MDHTDIQAQPQLCGAAAMKGGELLQSRHGGQITSNPGNLVSSVVGVTITPSPALGLSILGQDI